MKKVSKPKQPSKRVKAWIVTLGLVCLGLLIWFSVNAVQIAQDRTRFEEVSKQKSLVASQLAKTLGSNVVSTREHDECFNAEQGPWDNGRLWCQVATVIDLAQGVSYAEVGEEYLHIGGMLGLTSTAVTRSLFPSYTVRTSGGIDCELVLLAPDGSSTGAAMSIPFTSREKNAIAITCADRARGTFYPYSGE